MPGLIAENPVGFTRIPRGASSGDGACLRDWKSNAERFGAHDVVQHAPMHGRLPCMSVHAARYMPGC